MRRIYMSFFLRGGGWVCGFLEEDAKTAVGRIRTFGSADKVRELIGRTETQLDLAGHHALDVALEMGRGGLFLAVTDDQYRKLKL